MSKKNIDKGFLQSGAASITHEDIEGILAKEDEFRTKFQKGPLRKLWNDFTTLFSMIKDYVKGNYRHIPWWSVSAIAFSLLYTLSPVDLIPDVIPGIGLTDDAALISLCVMMVREDIHAYQAWKGAA